MSRQRMEEIGETFVLACVILCGLLWLLALAAARQFR